MRDKGYSDNRDLIKWSMLLLLARRNNAEGIIRIAMLNPIEFGNSNFRTPDRVSFQPEVTSR